MARLTPSVAAIVLADSPLACIRCARAAFDSSNDLGRPMDCPRARAKGFQRKSDAPKWLDSEVTAKLATGTYIEPSAGRVTVSAVYQTWSAAQSHISAKTAASRRSVWNSRVEPQWGDVLVGEVRSLAIRAWVAAMVAEGAGVPIIENAFGVLRQVLGAAVEDNRLARNPCDGVKLPSASTPTAAN